MWRPLYQRGVRFSSSYAPCTKYMRATHVEPSVKLDDAVHRYRETTLGTYVRPPIVFSHGRGLDLFATVPGEAQSRRYLDFTGGIAVNALGHADPQVAAIAAEQAAQLVHCSNLYYNTWSGELADRLASMTREHGGLGLVPQSPPAASGQDVRAFIANSGTEANEAALKFARKAAKGTALVCFQHAFHGRTMGALSVTPNAKYQAPFLPLVGDVRVGTLNDMAQLESLVTEDVAGVIVEPIQGEGGILPAQVEWLTALRQRCTAVGAALIYDEIQCGLFRTGHMWCHSAMPVEAHPDMVTMAKPLANGFPIGAVLMRPHIAHAIAAGDHGTTFGGGPLTCRIAHHVLGRLGEPRMKEHIDSVSTYLFERLERISEAFSDMVSAPRGRGLIAGISMRSAPWAGEVVRLARERGVLFLTAGSDAVRFVPSLIVERAHIDEAMDVLESVLLVLRST